MTRVQFDLKRVIRELDFAMKMDPRGYIQGSYELYLLMFKEVYPNQPIKLFNKKITADETYRITYELMDAVGSERFHELCKAYVDTLYER